MLSIKALQVALLVLILAFVVLLFTDVIRTPDSGWIEGVVLGAIAVMGGWTAYRRGKMQSQRKSLLRRTRDSFLKWRWEDRHRREW